MAKRNRSVFSSLVEETKPRILALLTAKGKMKPIVIRAELGLDDTLCRITLDRMRDDGQVESTGRYYGLRLAASALAKAANGYDEVRNQPMVWQEGQEIVTDSLTIAAYFEKEHRHVLEAIRGYLQSEAEDVKSYALPNFRQSKYLDSQGKSQIKFDVTRGGFGLVALGFSGLKADRIRVRFLQQFEKYEAQLKKIVEQDNTLITTLLERHEETFRILTTGQVTITKDLNEVKEDVVSIKHQVTNLDEKVSNITPIRRYDFPPSVTKIWLRIIIEYFKGYCPLCLINEIAKNDDWIPGAVQFAHVHDRDMNKVTDGVPACLDCHAEHRKSDGMGRYIKSDQIKAWINRVWNFVNFKNRKQGKLNI